MTTDNLDGSLKSIQSDINELEQSADDPLEFASRARDYLRETCDRGGLCAPEGERAEDGHKAYSQVVNILINKGLFASADALLQEWWNELANRQVSERKHFHRAAAAHMLSGLHLIVQNRDAAFRWSLLTHADDILGRHPNHGGGGKVRLRTLFGISVKAVDRLTKLAEKCLQEAEESPNGWSDPSGFAEEVVRRFALDNDAYANQIANLPSNDDFPLSPPYFGALLNRLEEAEDTQEKGKTLEELVHYLFSLLSGCVPRQNVRDNERAFESDIVVRNLYRSPTYLSEQLGRYCLVECKNWKEKVGVEPVGYFLFRMRMTHAQFGVICSRSGLTGSQGEDDEKAARALIRRNYHEHGSICVDLNLEDFKRLSDGRLKFSVLLLEKAEVLRFGSSKSSKDSTQ